VHARQDRDSRIATAAEHPLALRSPSTQRDHTWLHRFRPFDLG
jgi:hypothetical protein